MLELQGTAFGNLRQTFGGDTLNTAVYLARCGGAGLRVHYATALGDDSLSTGLLERWAAEGVQTGLVQRLPGRLPGLYLIELDAGGERRFHYWRGQAAARSYFDTATTALEEQADALAEDLLIVMRVYFEKPRTTVGWKGYINDPHLDGSFAINEGLELARQLLLDVLATGLPVGTEFLDLLSPQFISDLVSWGAIGARTTESQSHRQLASGLSCPVGFKNGTDGSVKVASDAIQAAQAPHAFMGMTKMGQAAIFETRGNQDCHVILRGGKAPNYSAEDVNTACALLKAAGQREQVMIDVSHANSSKQHRRQIDVAADVAGQIAAGDARITGIMIESHLFEGRQDIVPGQPLLPGVSVTDACISFEQTVPVLQGLAAAVRQRRAR